MFPQTRLQTLQTYCSNDLCQAGGHFVTGPLCHPPIRHHYLYVQAVDERAQHEQRRQNGGIRVAFLPHSAGSHRGLVLKTPFCDSDTRTGERLKLIPVLNRYRGRTTLCSGIKTSSQRRRELLGNMQTATKPHGHINCELTLQ